MLEIALMIEGQNGLTWPRWMRIAQAVEDLGFAGLYRSDHYTNANPPDKESLELWVSLTWLASHTRRIEFGPLVSPVSFRHPTLTARMAAAVDDLSNSRLILGLGAGWQEREHANYGWELLDLKNRFSRFEEGLQIIQHLLHSDTPLDFTGKYFQLQEAVLLPRPMRPGGPPLLIGGNGQTRTLGLAARYADEWNAVYITASEFQRLSQRLDSLLAEQGRKLESMRRSLMTGLIYDENEDQVSQRVTERTSGRQSAAELRQRGLVVGAASEVVEQLGRLAEAGVQRVMLQWLELDDMDRLESFGRQVIPQLKP